jgi:predicted ABC-type transport system involved in lysophospholipase L1 biosynthesis ATPase subunit
MNLPAHCRVSIPDGGMQAPCAFEFALGSGMRFGVLGASDLQVAALLRQLPPAPAMAYVASDGGLISNLRVGENIILPATYHSNSPREKFETQIVSVLSELDYSYQAACELIAKLPAELSVFEHRIVGFIRAVILQPAVIVYDSLWADLTAREFEQVVGFDTIFRRHREQPVSIYLHSGAQFPFDVAFNQTFVLQGNVR